MTHWWIKLDDTHKSRRVHKSWSLQIKDRQIKLKGQNEQKQRKTVGANIGRRARHREGPRARGLLRARFARHGLRRHYWCHPGVRQAGRGRPQGRARVEGSAPERTKTLLFVCFCSSDEVLLFQKYFFIFFQGPPVMTLEVGPPAPGALKGMELCLF